MFARGVVTLVLRDGRSVHARATRVDFGCGFIDGAHGAGRLGMLANAACPTINATLNQNRDIRVNDETYGVQAPRCSS